MVDDTRATETAGSICPWCSATYTGEPETCPSCGAALAVDPTTDAALPGLTAIDAAAIVRAKTPVARPRSRLLSWISGEYPDEAPTAADAGALAPPDAEVRREMLRLALEAEVANLQAEADALIAEATLEGRAPEATPEDAAAADAVVEDLKEVSAELDDVDEALDTDPLTDGDRQPA
jgi:rRNA maturation endonuclease Nob1